MSKSYKARIDYAIKYFAYMVNNPQPDFLQLSEKHLSYYEAWNAMVKLRDGLDGKKEEKPDDKYKESRDRWKKIALKFPKQRKELTTKSAGLHDTLEIYRRDLKEYQKKNAEIYAKNAEIEASTKTPPFAHIVKSCGKIIPVDFDKLPVTIESGDKFVMYTGNEIPDLECLSGGPGLYTFSKP